MFIQGILLGLSLSFMVGPLLFSLLQAALSGGMRAGLSTALGTWISDLFYVGAIFYGLKQMTTLSNFPDFKFWAGLAGGLILILFGLGSFWSRKSAFRMKADGDAMSVKGLRYWFFRGFLLNTINPFTVFFWLGLAGGYILPNAWSSGALLLFFAGMFGALVATDFLKVYLAKKISRLLTERHVSLVKQFMGFLLVVFGGVLIVRVL